MITWSFFTLSLATKSTPEGVHTDISCNKGFNSNPVSNPSWGGHSSASPRPLPLIGDRPLPCLTLLRGLGSMVLETKIASLKSKVHHYAYILLKIHILKSHHIANKITSHTTNHIILYNKYMKYHNNFSNINRKMHASSKMFLFSYLMQDVPDGDGTSTLWPWNVSSQHRRLVYRI